MISALVVLVTVVLAAGAIITIWAASTAPDAYEDDTGFHPGAIPQHGAVQPAAINTSEQPLHQTAAHDGGFPLRISREPLHRV